MKLALIAAIIASGQHAGGDPEIKTVTGIVTCGTVACGFLMDDFKSADFHGADSKKILAVCKNEADGFCTITGLYSPNEKLLSKVTKVSFEPRQ